MNTTAVHNFTFGPFLQYTWDNVQDLVLGELAGVFFPAKVVAPLMVERKRGNLIAISSTVSRRPTEGKGSVLTRLAKPESVLLCVSSEPEKPIPARGKSLFLSDRFLHAYFSVPVRMP